jgi:hypothetical protein
MVEPRIVETFAVGDQGAEDRADFQQLIPIAIVAGQAGGIVAEHQACASQTNFSEQILETAARKGVGSRFAQILINDFHSLNFAIPIGQLAPLVSTGARYSQRDA